MQAYHAFIETLLKRVIPEAKTVVLHDAVIEIKDGSRAAAFHRAVLSEEETLLICCNVNTTWIRTLPFILADALVAAYGRDFQRRLTPDQRLQLTMAQQRTPLRPLFWDALPAILEEEHTDPSDPLIVCATALTIGEPVPLHRLDPFVFVFDVHRPIYMTRLWAESADHAWVPTDAIEALERDVAYWATPQLLSH